MNESGWWRKSQIEEIKEIAHNHDIRNEFELDQNKKESDTAVSSKSCNLNVLISVKLCLGLFYLNSKRERNTKNTKPNNNNKNIISHLILFEFKSCLIFLLNNSISNLKFRIKQNPVRIANAWVQQQWMRIKRASTAISNFLLCCCVWHKNKSERREEKKSETKWCSITNMALKQNRNHTTPKTFLIFGSWQRVLSSHCVCVFFLSLCLCAMCLHTKWTYSLTDYQIFSYSLVSFGYHYRSLNAVFWPVAFGHCQIFIHAIFSFVNGLQTTHTHTLLHILYCWANMNTIAFGNVYRNIKLCDKYITVWDYTFEFIGMPNRLYITKLYWEIDRSIWWTELRREQKEHQLHKIMAIHIQFNTHYYVCVCVCFPGCVCIQTSFNGTI